MNGSNCTRYDFDTVIDRHGSWCTQWDFVADRFGVMDLLPFTISDMDFVTAPCIRQALMQRLEHGVFGYTRWQHDDFLSACHHWMSSRFHYEPDASTIVYAPSVIYMVSQMLHLWSEAGDEVIIHTPAYDGFYKTIRASQRHVVEMPLRYEAKAWHCDMSQLEKRLARPRCKVLLLCSPHNPTGKVWTHEELYQIAALCERHKVKVISDEIHMDMVTGNDTHLPWSKVARDNWALFTSASKSFNIPALTGAWGIIPSAVDRTAWFNMIKNRDGLSSPSVMAVAAHIAAYREGAPWLDALRRYLRANLCYLAERLNNSFPELNWVVPQATYLAWIDLSPLNIDADLLQSNLIHEQRIAIMPGATYGETSKNFLRLNAGCPRRKVDAGVSGLLSAIQTLRS